MTRKKKLARVNKVAIAEAAWELCYLKEMRFTTAVFAEYLQMPANRHFRQYLNSLAQATPTRPALLLAYRELDEDGRYRKYFYAQKTAAMLTPQEMRKVA